MSPTQLELAIARATGESRREIRRRGFQLHLFEAESEPEAPETDPTIVDWDTLDLERRVVFP